MDESRSTITTEDALAKLLEASQKGAFTVDLPESGKTDGSFLWFDNGNRLEVLLWIGGERRVFSASQIDNQGGPRITAHQVCGFMAQAVLELARPNVKTWVL